MSKASREKVAPVHSIVGIVALLADRKRAAATLVMATLSTGSKRASA